MSFFYGLEIILVTPEDVSGSAPSAISIDETTILPGHHFKDGFMTGILVITILTWAALALLYRAIFRLKLPAPPGLRKRERRAWSRKWDATHLALPAIVVFVIYLTFDIVIRICIELRLHVPVGFAAIEIPSKTFLVVADLLLLLLVVSTNESMIMRLEVDHGFRYTLHICVVGLSCSAVVLLGIAERAYAIVAGVKWGFAWDKPDWINYAIVRLAYSSVYLGLALFSFAAALVVLRIRNRISRQTSYVDLCGKIPSYSASVMTTALIVHSFSTFYFTYFYHYKQKPQPPHLELLRMALVCLPVIIVLIGAWQAKREDVRMNADTKIPYYDGQAESMLGRNSVDFQNMAAYDVDGRKVVDVIEAPVPQLTGKYGWAPPAYEAVPVATNREFNHDHGD